MKKLTSVCLLSAMVVVTACNNGSGTDHQMNNNDTNYSDSRRNAPITENTITGDSTANRDSTKAFDSAQHKGREGNH